MVNWKSGCLNKRVSEYFFRQSTKLNRRFTKPVPMTRFKFQTYFSDDLIWRVHFIANHVKTADPGACKLKSSFLHVIVIRCRYFTESTTGKTCRCSGVSNIVLLFFSVFCFVLFYFVLIFFPLFFQNGSCVPAFLYLFLCKTTTLLLCWSTEIGICSAWHE